MIELFPVQVFAEEEYTTTTEVIVEETEDSLIVPDSVSNRKKRKLLLGNRTVYGNAYGEQLSGLSREVYDAIRELYRTEKKTGNQAYTLNEPIVFNGTYVDGSIVKDDAYNAELLKIRTACQSAMDAFLYDYPDVFWMRTLKYSYTMNYSIRGTAVTVTINTITFMPTEFMQGISAYIVDYDNAVESAVAEIKTLAGKGASRYETVKAIHDYLCTKLHYDYTYSTESHSTIPVFLGEGAVVCEGYGKTFKVLCDQLKIPCVCVAGVAHPDTEESEGHMWNYVQMEDDKWYLMDVTWDDQTYKTLYIYFLTGWDEDGFTGTIREERVETTDFSNQGYMNFVYPVIENTAYVPVAEHEHILSFVEEIAPTCENEGTTAHYVCTFDRCGKMFSDENAENPLAEEDLVLPATGHDYQLTKWNWSSDYSTASVLFTCSHDETHTVTEEATIQETTVNPTCKEEGKTTYTATVSFEEKEYTDQKEVSIPTVDHQWSEWTTVEEPTEESSGSEERICSVGGEKETRVIPPLAHTHQLTYHPANEAECEEDGNIAYWYCEKCGLYFSDGNGENIIDAETIIVPATGHAYVLAGWIWADDFQTATAVFACDNDSSHTQMVRTTPSARIKEASCTEDGQASYYAFITFEEREYSSNKDVILPATGHKWSEWITVKEATDTEEGLEERTCLICNEKQSANTTSIQHVHTMNHVEAKDATCEEAGNIEYWYCDSCLTHYSDENFENVISPESTIIPAKGHRYALKEWTWSDDNLKVTAVFTCENDSSHTQSVSADASLRTQQPTCTADGKLVYHTIVIFEDQEYSTSKEVVIKASGHNWSEWKTVKAPTYREKGVKERICSICGEKETEEIPVKERILFDDVKDPLKSFYDAVYWAVDHEITQGTSKEPPLFSPYKTCTRGQFVTFLWRQKGCPEPKTTVNPFKDIAPDKSFYKAVLWAYENDITTGTSKTTFEPYKDVNRAQVATFLWRAADKPASYGDDPFTDVPENVYYTNAVAWMVNHGITTGTSPVTFSPDRNCTRGQTVTFLYRTYKD